MKAIVALTGIALLAVLTYALSVVLRAARDRARGSSVSRRAIGLAAAALIGVPLLGLVLLRLSFGVFSLPSGGMEPTIKAGDRILVSRLAYRLGPVRRGDIVVFEAPQTALGALAGMATTANQLRTKRVVALPGDSVRIVSGKGVFVNGSRARWPLAEPPVSDWPTGSSGGPSGAATVPPGRCFVLGDNINNSMDSRHWQDPRTGEAAPFLPLASIRGKMITVLFHGAAPGR